MTRLPTFPWSSSGKSTGRLRLSRTSSRDRQNDTGYPKAYINWIFLDDQFNYVSALSGSVLAASSTYPAGSMNLVAPGGPITLNRSGYLYIWVSNETTGWDVYFDNLSVQYKQGPLLEENHYYPFGLTMAGISDKAIKTNYSENKYRYNSGNELQNKEFSDGSGLELYDAGFRQLDPQLGRFAQIDPLSEMADFSSTYGYANNNPVSMSDPAGLKAQKPPSSLYTYSGLSDQQLADGMMGYLNVSYLESPSNNGPGEGGGMYIGNGMYQLPDGEIVDQQTATDYVTNKYPGSTQSFYGAQAAAVYSYFTGQGNVSTTANNGVQTLNYQYNTTEDGVPVVHDVTATLNGN